MKPEKDRWYKLHYIPTKEDAHEGAKAFDGYGKYIGHMELSEYLIFINLIMEDLDGTLKLLIGGGTFCENDIVGDGKELDIGIEQLYEYWVTSESKSPITRMVITDVHK